MSESSSILNTDESPVEERVTTIPTNTGCYLLIFLIIWCIIAGAMFIFIIIIFPLMCIAPLILEIIGICLIFSIRAESEIIINNSNFTLTLIGKKICKCRKPNQRIIDLSQIAKIQIYKTEKIKKSINKTNNNYIIYYKGGSSEDITDFFMNSTEKSLINCENLLKKYIFVDNTISTMNPMVEMMGVNVYSEDTSGTFYNSNIQNQNYNPVMEKKVPQNFNSDME